MADEDAPVAFGWKLLKCGTLVECEEEQSVIKSINECLRHGMTYRDLLEALVNAGVVDSRVRGVLVRADLRGRHRC